MTVNRYRNGAFERVPKVGRPTTDASVKVRRADGFEEIWPGNVVPDAEDVQLRYDWSEEDGTLPVTDQSGNGNDLDLGQYSGVSVSINGVQAGDFAGGGTAAEDWLGGEDFTTVSPPYHDFIVLEPRNVTNTQYLFSLIGSSHPSVRSINSDDRWAVRPNSFDANVDGSGVDTPILLEVLWKETETTIYNVTAGLQDTEAQTAGESTSLRLARRDGTGFYLNAKIGEHVRYNTSKESIRTDVHNYLSEKWGLGL